MKKNRSHTSFEDNYNDYSVWKRVGFIATIILVLAVPFYYIHSLLNKDLSYIQMGSGFVGKEACIECHKKEYDLWNGSHHDLAMDSATEESVLGDFNNYRFKHKGQTHHMFRKNGRFYVNTKGETGELRDYEVAYTFGHTPLQQYLVPFEGGRLQCLPLAWDTERNTWFHLADTVYPGHEIDPDNWLHWTNQAQNWNSMCADCHSTNLKKNYDLKSKTYNTTWSEIDVSCEACHGPASKHMEWAELPEGSRSDDINAGLTIKTRDISNTELLNVCARCHSRRSILGDYDNDNEDILNYMVPQLITPPLYYVDGQIKDEDYVYGSFTQSKMYLKGVKCSDCHDIHSLKTKFDDNDLCLQCHRPDIYNTPDHHFHKMEDENSLTPLTNRNKPQYTQGTGAQCVNCHMDGRFYMGNDYRRDHSFRIPRPDLTVKYNVPNACNSCHTDKSAVWADEYIKKWYGIKKTVHYGELFQKALDGDPDVIPSLVLMAENELFPLMIRATAIQFLGNYSDSISVSAIEKALSDPESLIRHTAVMNYHVSDVQEYEKLSLPLLNDPVRSIRSESAIRLSRIPTQMLSQPAQKALEGAMEEYLNINQYVADFPGGQFNIGVMYDNQGETEKAIMAYKEALKIDGLFTRAKVNLAMIYNRSGQNEEAEKLFREVLVEAPELVEINYSLALLLVEMGKTEESRIYFMKSIDAMPENNRVLYNFALLENSLKHFDSAEKYFLQAVKKEPGNFDFIYAICTYYLGQNQHDKALPYAKKLKAYFPQNPVSQQLLDACTIK